MKILHVSSAMTWRGGEQQIAWLIEGLQLSGVISQVFCAKDSAMATYCQEKNIPFFPYPKRAGISLSVSRLLKKITVAQQPDLIHLHDSHAHSYGVVSAAFFGNKNPMVLSRRVDFPIGQSFLSRWKYNHASVQKIICVSDFIRKLVVGSIEKPNRAITVHSGIDTNRFSEKKSGKLRQLLNIGKEIPLIGNVAALAPHKDHFTFVDACQKILAKVPEAIFVIIGGDGGTQSEIEKYISQKNLGDKIQLLGFRKNVPALLADLDVFLFSSKTEGLGTSVIDAMAAMVPIVTTNAGGIPELVDHFKNGWLTEVGNAGELAEGVLYVFENQQTASEWVQSGKIKLAEFDKSVTAQKTFEIYSELIAS